MTDLPPNRKPYLIMSPEDRIGTPHIPVDPEKVIAIVESDYPDLPIFSFFCDHDRLFLDM
jgi:acetyl-CoA hydrolase